MKNLFIHKFLIKNDNGEEEEWIAEQEPITTLDEAIKMYPQQKYKWNEYLHTLMITYSDNLSDSMVKEIDIEVFLNETVKKSFKPDYERVTGHEYGVAKGRV